MRINCETVIDNPDDRELFIKKVKCLDVKVEEIGSIVRAEYIGYNQGLSEVLLNTFEEQPRSSIKINHH